MQRRADVAAGANAAERLVSVGIIALIEAKQAAIAADADHDHDVEAQIVHATLGELVRELRKFEETDYLGVLYRTDYCVTGRGGFPIDMLRYTSSYPNGESDAREIENSLEHADGDDAFTIRLSKYHRDPKPQLAEDRWLSKFRWKVIGTVDTVEL
jgi:hypothetical protein